MLKRVRLQHINEGEHNIMSPEFATVDRDGPAKVTVILPKRRNYLRASRFHRHILLFANFSPVKYNSNFKLRKTIFHFVIKVMNDVHKIIQTPEVVFLHSPLESYINIQFWNVYLIFIGFFFQKFAVTVSASFGIP